MNIKKTTNSPLSKTEPKNQTKQTTSTGIESQIWRSFGGLSAGRGKGENEEKGAGIKYNWQVQNRQGGVKSCTGNGKAKEPICMTNGRELRGVLLQEMGVLGGGGKGEKLEQL